MSFSRSVGRLNFDIEETKDTRLGFSGIQRAKIISVTSLKDLSPNNKSKDGSQGNGNVPRRVGTPFPSRRQKLPEKLPSSQPTGILSLKSLDSPTKIVSNRYHVKSSQSSASSSRVRSEQSKSSAFVPPSTAFHDPAIVVAARERRGPPATASTPVSLEFRAHTQMSLPPIASPEASSEVSSVVKNVAAAACVEEEPTMWTSPKAVVLHSGSKLFWRIRRTIHYRVYLSEEAQVVVLRWFDPSDSLSSEKSPLVMDRSLIMAQVGELEAAGFVLEVEPHKPACTDEEKIVAFVINRIEAYREAALGEIKVRISKRPRDSYETLDFPLGSIPENAENIGRGAHWDVGS